MERIGGRHGRTPAQVAVAVAVAWVLRNPAVTGAIILTTDGYYWLDPAVALAVSAVIAYHAIKLLHGVIVTLRS